VTKAVLLLGPDGIASVPPILCADNLDEARRGGIPFFDEIIAQLSGGKEIRSIGDSGYELYENGQRVGSLEIFELPASMERIRPNADDIPSARHS
jgi:hypothetical protein